MFMRYYSENKFTTKFLKLFVICALIFGIRIYYHVLVLNLQNAYNNESVSEIKLRLENPGNRVN